MADILNMSLSSKFYLLVRLSQSRVRDDCLACASFCENNLFFDEDVLDSQSYQIVAVILE